jgi:hypothetical protein
MGNLLPPAGQKGQKKAENLLGIAFGSMSKSRMTTLWRNLKR